jgi:16S rRNA (adenine1518-N6/adenine1519-N6)-dimethyltransferase
VITKKKSLGQHFLNNRHYLGLVADATQIKKGDTVVEIGPGEGTLTAVLLERGAKVVALEKDSRLIALLRDKFAGENFEVIEGDALDFVPPKKYKLVGNIPYYITGALLRKFLSEKNQPSMLVFLMQKEVAERIARNKKESILSLSIKAYGVPKYIKTVPAGAFNPPPKVDSAILAVENISRTQFTNAAHEEKFFELVKKGFSSKRKMLAGNLGKEYSNNLENVGVSLKARAEDVPLEQWLELARR